MSHVAIQPKYGESVIWALNNYLNGLKALSLVMLFAKQNEAESSHF